MPRKQLDWVEAYSEARVAFPSDVWLRTTDDESGGVEITAYRREFEPPLPDGYVVGASVRDVLTYAPLNACGYPTGPTPTVLHREVVPSLSYVVRDPRMAGRMARFSAHRRATEAAQRGQRP